MDHAASPGLPASLWSIAETLKGRYNVVVLRQGGDPGEPDFAADASDELVLPSGFTADPAEADAIARAIAAHHAPCYAITTCSAMQGLRPILRTGGNPDRRRDRPPRG